jgi:O-antigen/teichoic acid export membrane protein/O-antigen ligase
LEVVTSPASPPTRNRIRAARGVLWLSGSAWTAKGAQTVVLLVLAKALTPSQFGILAVAALMYNVLLVLTHLGIVDALTYLKDRIEEASRTALSIVIVGGLVLTGVTWAIAPLVAHFFHSPDATFVLRGFAIGIPFDAAAQVPIGRLTRSLSFSKRTITDSLPSVIGAAVTIAVVASGHPLVGLVAGQITGSVTNATVAMLIGPRCRPGWSPVMARQLLSYGKYLSAADLLNLGLLNVDYVIVGHVLGPVALGYYSLAYRICFMPYLSISVVANGALFPYYCRLPSQEAKARTAESAFSLITALSIPWFAGLVLFAGDIALLGHKWAPATGAVRFLAVYGLFLSLILSALEVLKAVGRPNLVFLARGLHLAVLTVVLIATVHLGITVVAFDQAVVAAAIAGLTGLWIIRYASLRPAALSRSVGLPLVGALGMVPVVLLLGHVPGLAATPSWTGLLTLGPLALAVFVVILCVLMPGPLRQGWAALRGKSAGQPAAGLPVLPGTGAADGSPGAAYAVPAAAQVSPVMAWARHHSVLVGSTVVVALALAAVVPAGGWPVPTVAALAAVVVFGLILCRLDMAVAMLAAEFFFNSYLAHGAGIITIDKGLGALAVGAWLLDWAVTRRPVILTRQLWLLGAFLLWSCVSVGFAVSDKAALVTLLRYVIFATLFFLVLQAVRGERRRADVLIRVLIVAAVAASVIGLVAFLSHHVTRASGPISDPNDFGFILGSSLPLTIYLMRWGARWWSKTLWAVALVMILACTLATFSRSALAGLAAAGLWALVTRRLRLRWLLAVIAVLAVVALGAVTFAPKLVQTAFGAKAHVANANVDVRIGYYRVELAEWEHYPITGVGPGNYVYRFFQFAPAVDESLPYPSNVLTISGEEAYLVILAEQGAVGLALFLAYLALSWVDLRRRFPDDKQSDQLQTALAAGFIVACVGALFLAEQYYPPLWFLPAVAASLAARRPRAAGGDGAATEQDATEVAGEGSRPLVGSSSGGRR